MLILNTGGTFNKKYNSLSGKLEVPYDNSVITEILKTVDDYNLAGVIYKDSFEIDNNDRKMLANIIMESNEDSFIIIHGTDTMSETAEFLDAIFEDRKIILVGAMKPFEVDKVEASLNLGMAIGYAKAINNCGVYITMNGHVEVWNKLVKNRSIGKFELVK